MQKGGPEKMTVRSNSRAFTLLELLGVIVVVSVLSTLVAVGYQQSLKKIDSAHCMSNLRGIGVALSSYHADFQKWPQVPEEVKLGSVEEEMFWIESLLPYGLTEKNWRCRTQDRLLKFDSKTPQVAKIHYIPSLFDGFPLSSQGVHQALPWVMEIADVHGNGNHVLMSDGRVRTYKDIFESTVTVRKSVR
jgi:prepilin-type N-terminal cleavage/methylation domain-containing protein